MIHLSNVDAKRLVKLLDQAATIARQHAAEQSYRRDACRAVRERILTDYHDRQHRAALDVADDLVDQGGRLLVRIEAADSAA